MHYEYLLLLPVTAITPSLNPNIVYNVSLNGSLTTGTIIGVVGSVVVGGTVGVVGSVVVVVPCLTKSLEFCFS